MSEILKLKPGEAEDVAETSAVFLYHGRLVKQLAAWQQRLKQQQEQDPADPSEEPIEP